MLLLYTRKVTKIDPSNYRPVNLTSQACKVLESIVHYYTTHTHTNYYTTYTTILHKWPAIIPCDISHRKGSMFVIIVITTGQEMFIVK